MWPSTRTSIVSPSSTWSDHRVAGRSRRCRRGRGHGGGEEGGREHERVSHEPNVAPRRVAVNVRESIREAPKQRDRAARASVWPAVNGRSYGRALVRACHPRRSARTSHSSPCRRSADAAGGPLSTMRKYGARRRSTSGCETGKGGPSVAVAQRKEAREQRPAGSQDRVHDARVLLAPPRGRWRRSTCTPRRRRRSRRTAAPSVKMSRCS